MSVVVERSPANARSVEGWMFELIEVVQRLSPTDNLIARQWYILNVFGCFPWLNLLSPAALTLALLDVAMLDKGAIVILVQDFIP